MRQFEQDWLELGRRVVCSLHYQHPRNLRLLHAAQAEGAERGRCPGRRHGRWGLKGFGGPCWMPTAERLG